MKWRRLGAFYLGVFALLMGGLLAVEHDGSSASFDVPQAGAFQAAQPVGQSTSKVDKFCDDESSRCAEAPASGSLSGDCTAGTTLIAKFEVNGSGQYVFEKPAGNQGVVTISNAGSTGGFWSSTAAIKAIVIKASTDAKIIAHNPPAFSGSFNNSGMTTPSGQVPAISNIRFCA